MVKSTSQQLLSLVLALTLTACAELEPSSQCPATLDNLPGKSPASAEGLWTLRGSGCACQKPFTLKTRTFSVSQGEGQLRLSSTPDLLWFEGEIEGGVLTFQLNYQLEESPTAYALTGFVTAYGDNYLEGQLSGDVVGCEEEAYGSFSVDFDGR